MWELYLITRLSSISTILWISLIFSIFCLAFFIIFKFLNGRSNDGLEIMITDSYDRVCNSVKLKSVNSIIRNMTISVIVCSILIIAIPTKKELLYIYGFGNVVEYVKDSDEIKKLPDNTVKVLNKLCEDYLNENEYTEIK